jgi:hypothetical protein
MKQVPVGVAEADLTQLRGKTICPPPWFSPPIKTDCHNITEILLKVALKTITHNPFTPLFGKNLRKS